MPEIDWSGGTVPEGNYTLRILNVEEDVSSKGFERWVLEMEVIKAAEEENKKYVGRLIEDTLLWSPNQIWYVKRVIGGIFPEHRESGKTITYEPDMLIGKVIEAEVEQRKFGEDTVNRMKSVKRISIEEIEPEESGIESEATAEAEDADEEEFEFE